VLLELACLSIQYFRAEQLESMADPGKDCGLIVIPSQDPGTDGYGLHG